MQPPTVKMISSIDQASAGAALTTLEAQTDSLYSASVPTEHHQYHYQNQKQQHLRMNINNLTEPDMIANEDDIKLAKKRLNFDTENNDPLSLYEKSKA